MNKRELEKFKKRLEADRNELSNRPRSGQFDVEHTKGDEIDEANALANMALCIRLTERDTYLVRKIDHALVKISDRRYGDCESCGDAIEIKRLEARPTAGLCIKCKEEEERLEKSYSR